MPVCAVVLLMACGEARIVHRCVMDDTGDGHCAFVHGGWLGSGEVCGTVVVIHTVGFTEKTAEELAERFLGAGKEGMRQVLTELPTDEHEALLKAVPLWIEKGQEVPVDERDERAVQRLAEALIAVQPEHVERGESEEFCSGQVALRKPTVVDFSVPGYWEDCVPAEGGGSFWGDLCSFDFVPSDRD